MPFGGAFFKQNQASFFFFLERLWTLSVGAGGRDLQAFWMEDLKESHTEFMLEAGSNLSKVSAKTD